MDYNFNNTSRYRNRSKAPAWWATLRPYAPIGAKSDDDDDEPPVSSNPLDCNVHTLTFFYLTETNNIKFYSQSDQHPTLNL